MKCQVLVSVNLNTLPLFCKKKNKKKTKTKQTNKTLPDPKIINFFSKKKYFLKMLSAIEYNFAHEHSIIIK